MTDEQEALLRLVQAAIQTHRDQHMIYGSTSTCGGGIGGAAMTQHCSVTCGYYERHEAENDRWHDVETAYFRRQEGDPEWVDYIPGGRLSRSSNPPCRCGAVALPYNMTHRAPTSDTLHTTDECVPFDLAGWQDHLSHNIGCACGCGRKDTALNALDWHRLTSPGSTPGGDA